MDYFLLLFVIGSIHVMGWAILVGLVRAWNWCFSKLPRVIHYPWVHFHRS